MKTADGANLIYIAEWYSKAAANEIFSVLWNGLDWERRGNTPRREWYHDKLGEPYTYGKGVGVRTYESHSINEPTGQYLYQIWRNVEDYIGFGMDVCFINGYEDKRDQLGWHADDSPEMDDDRPIAIVTFGGEREIMFRRDKEKYLQTHESADDLNLEVTKLLLNHGSLCVMPAGFQDTHQHRIPKASAEVKPRISLTFRGRIYS